MNCTKCGAINPDTANFCNQCGESLSNAAVSETNKLSRSLVLLVIVMSWELVMSLIWLLVQKVLTPMLTGTTDITDFDRVNLIYQSLGWFFSIVSIAMGITFSILARNKAARGILIAYTVINFISFIAYRVFELL